MRTNAGLLFGLVLIAGASGCSDIAEPGEDAVAIQPSTATAGTGVAVSGITVASGRAYRAVTGGLRSGVKYYIDRSFTIGSPVPAPLQNLTFIQTAKADDEASPGSSSFLSFNVDRAVTVYVARDPRLALPGWLKSGYVDTQLDILTPDYRERLRVYKRGFPQGKVTLGSNIASGSGGGAMYVVALAPAASSSTSGSHAGWQVAPGGTSSGSGTGASPWSLTYAFAGAGGKVQPGDTVWLRGGTYPGVLTSSLRGTSSAPIIVRQWPGERARLTGTVTVNGQDTWYWGFEVGNTNASTWNVMGVNVHAPRTKLINLTVHDHSGNGIGVWSDAPNSEVVGCVLYNNGYQGSSNGSYGHGIYSQSEQGTQVFRQNVLYNQYGWGFHIYAEGGGLNGFTLEKNIAFDNGLWVKTIRPGLFVGGYPAAASRVVVTDNSIYQAPSLPAGGTRALELGWGSQNQDVRLERNWIVGGDPTFKVVKWSQATVANNRIYSRGSNSIVFLGGGRSGWSWSGNTWYQEPSSNRWWLEGSYYSWSAWKSRTGLGGSDQVAATRPSGTWVRVWANPYEKGRGVIAVYNWALAPSVTVDLSQVVPAGKAYEIRNAQDPWGAPMASGTGGGSVSLPMLSVKPPTPIRGSNSVSVPLTGPEFNVFIVSPKN